MSRKCLAIGVSSVEPVDRSTDDFPYLDGAVIAAETIGQWALHSGFTAEDVIVLTDKGTNTVTDTDLQDAFDKLLPQGAVIDHFVLDFTGHGLTGINDDTTYWLLSDSLDQGYNIFVEDLRRQLYAYGLQHLTIFSDACRAIANSRDLRGLLPRPGARKRHQPPLPDTEIARFSACQDATSAFMIKVPGAAAPGKCIFSSVLAEALWGRIPAAFDGTVIDSSSLGRGLRAAAKERATQYNLTLVPGGSAFFDKVVYFDEATPPLPPDPEFAPWPAAEATEASRDGAPAAEAEEQPTPGLFKSVLSDPAVRTAVLGKTFGLNHIGLIAGLTAFPGLPDTARSIVENVGVTRKRLASDQISAQRKLALEDHMSEQLKTLEALAAGEARTKKAEELRATLRLATPARDGMARFLIRGELKQIWSSTELTLLNQEGGTSIIAPSLAGEEALLMLEFADGLFAPVWFYSDLAGTLLRDADGVVAVSYSQVFGDGDGVNAAATAISRLVSGKLSVDEVDTLATDLRHEKHVNPVFGAIAAYCYDVTGDLNSIRRMAAFYAGRKQAAPYDIILMGMIKNDGAIAQVLEVSKDTRQRTGDPPAWLVVSTAAIEARIAGRCPWLRQGWDFLGSSTGTELPLVDRLDQFRSELTSSIFTTLKRDGGAALATRWGLRPKLII